MRKRYVLGVEWDVKCHHMLQCPAEPSPECGFARVTDCDDDFSSCVGFEFCFDAGHQWILPLGDEYPPPIVGLWVRLPLGKGVLTIILQAIEIKKVNMSFSVQTCLDSTEDCFLPSSHESGLLQFDTMA